MATITLRLVKGSPLTIAELDNNFSNINLELTTDLNASALARGTIPNARFPATLPAISGANLTALNASNLASGTVPGARGITAGSVTPSFVSYNGTTNTAGQFNGGATAPTATTRLNYAGYFYATRFYGNGSNITALNASQLSTGTIPNARFPATLPAISGANLTNLNASNLASGTVPGARGVVAGSAVTSFVVYNGTTKAGGNFYGGATNPTLTTRLNYDGELYVTTLVEPSDIRLKKDINVIENALDKVSNISGYTYTMIATGERKTGLIAQELQDVLPEAVAGDENGLAVAYGNVVGLLVEAIKELRAEVAELKAK